MLGWDGGWLRWGLGRGWGGCLALTWWWAVDLFHACAVCWGWCSAAVMCLRSVRLVSCSGACPGGAFAVLLAARDLVSTCVLFCSLCLPASVSALLCVCPSLSLIASCCCCFSVPVGLVFGGWLGCTFVFCLAPLPCWLCFLSAFSLSRLALGWSLLDLA